MKSPIGIGLLGTGFMARKHALNLKQSGIAQIVAVCGSTLSKAEKFLKDNDFPEAKAYGDFKTMIEEARPQALYVTLPPFAHEGQVELAASKGIHLFLEKPIALTLERAESMKKAATQAGIITQVGYHMRFRKTLSRIRELKTKGETGVPTLFQGRFFTRFEGPLWWKDKNREEDNFSNRRFIFMIWQLTFLDLCLK